MKKFLLRVKLLLVLIVIFSFNSEAQKTNFSGSWKLNIEKSEFGNVPAKAAVKRYEVDQKLDKISLTWITQDENNKDVTSSQDLLLDGSKSFSLLPSKRTRTISMSFSEDGKTLILNKFYSKPDKTEVDYTLKENWQLLDEGKFLVIELTSPTYVIKAFYDKQ